MDFILQPAEPVLAVAGFILQRVALGLGAAAFILRRADFIPAVVAAFIRLPVDSIREAERPTLRRRFSGRRASFCGWWISRRAPTQRPMGGGQFAGGGLANRGNIGSAVHGPFGGGIGGGGRFGGGELLGLRWPVHAQ